MYVAKSNGRANSEIRYYMLHKVLNKIKIIVGIEKVDDNKILIKTDEKLPNDVSLKNVVILITRVIKDDDKFYPQIFWEEASVA